MAIWCARPARLPPGELLQEGPTSRRLRNPVALPEPPRGQIAYRERQIPLSDAARSCRAQPTSRLKVEPGETVAVVGPSGAGKSTLFQLAAAFLRSAKRARSARWRAADQRRPGRIPPRMALVPQEGVLFAASRARQSALWQLAGR
jgi:ATP-binding cassette subfamily B protein